MHRNQIGHALYARRKTVFAASLLLMSALIVTLLAVSTPISSAADNSTNEILDLSDSAAFIDSIARYTVDTPNHTITVSGTERLIIQGDGTNGGNGWTVIVSEATDITLAAGTKIVASTNKVALGLGTFGTVTVNGMGTSPLDAPTVKSADYHGISVFNGNLEISGTVGYIDAESIGINADNGNIEILGTVGDINAYSGIVARNGNIWISGTVGDIDSGLACIYAYDGSIEISGTVGDISSLIGTAIFAGPGSITISGSVGEIDAATNGIDANTDILITGSVGNITASDYGLYVELSTYSVIISGKVGSISASVPIRASRYAVLDYTGLDLTGSTTAAAITVTFDYGTLSPGGDELQKAYLAGTGMNKIPEPTAPLYDPQDWYDVRAGRSQWDFVNDQAANGLTLYTIDEVAFTAVQVGGTSLKVSSTGIEITFSMDVFGLTLSDITVTDGTGSVVVGTLTETTGTGTGSIWVIGLASVSIEGDVTVEIANFGRFDVTSPAQTVEVYKNAAPPAHYITSSSDTNSVVSPEGKMTVTKGSSITFTFTAKAGYHISSVTIDGTKQLDRAQIKEGKYTFNDVRSNHTITVAAAAGPGPDVDGENGEDDTKDVEDAAGSSNNSLLILAIAIVIVVAIVCVAMFVLKRPKST